MQLEQNQKCNNVTKTLMSQEQSNITHQLHLQEKLPFKALPEVHHFHWHFFNITWRSFSPSKTRTTSTTTEANFFLRLLG